MIPTIRMIDTPLQNLVNQVQAHFNILLPVSGGMGSSKDEPIILNIDNANLIAPLQHAMLHYLTLFRDHTFELVDTKVIDEEGGPVIEKVRTSFSYDPSYFHTYYFDITRPWRSDSKPLTLSGNPWFPDSELTIHQEE